ncbi:MAG TPA: M1 family metallopeptidase [Puia sp.]|nr:M1 family metallopeptidase [Puia sp.]
MVLRLSFLALLICLFHPRARAQDYNPAVDVKDYKFLLEVNDHNDSITGRAVIDVLFKTQASGFQLDLKNIDSQGKGMRVIMIMSQAGSKLPFIHEKDHLTISDKVDKGARRTYFIYYEGIPADGLIISKNKYGHRGFFGDNWPNRAHNWLPCVDDPSDKATVSFTVKAPDHYTVVANGELMYEHPMPDSMRSTRWEESVPLSPKIMMVGIADFAVDHPGDAEGVPVYNYVYPEDKEAGFRSYANALRILPFYIHHIGAYPFEKCGNVQSKTRFGGLENASAICYFENSVNSPGVESLMAHEIAHQWFGDAVTEIQWRHLWLSEGFATYMTHCYLESQYGADTLKAGLRKDRATAIAFEKKRMTPVVDSSVHSDYMELLNPNSYQKGGWVLHMLRRKIGDSLFWKAISTYYTTYRNGNASTEDLEKIVEKVSGQDLHTFFHQWLYTPGHPSVQLEWYYDGANDALYITTTQRQPVPFEFPLELSIDGKPYTIQLTAQKNQVRIPLIAEPTTIVPDPNVNILASFTMPSTQHRSTN